MNAYLGQLIAELLGGALLCAALGAAILSIRHRPRVGFWLGIGGWFGGGLIGFVIWSSSYGTGAHPIIWAAVAAVIAVAMGVATATDGRLVAPPDEKEPPLSRQQLEANHRAGGPAASAGLLAHWRWMELQRKSELPPIPEPPDWPERRDSEPPPLPVASRGVLVRHTAPDRTPEARLSNLVRLRDTSSISEDEYREARKRIVNEL